MRRASWWRGGEEGEQHPPARAASTAAADLGGGSGEGKAPGVGARWRGRTARAGRWGGGGAGGGGRREPESTGAWPAIFIARRRGWERKGEEGRGAASTRGTAGPGAGGYSSVSERASNLGRRSPARSEAASQLSALRAALPAECAGGRRRSQPPTRPRRDETAAGTQARGGVSFPFHPLVHHSPVPQLICLIRF